MPAYLPEDVEKSIVGWCLRLFERLECRDYCGFDWRLDGRQSETARSKPESRLVLGRPSCQNGRFPAGISYRETLEAILSAAENRLGIQPNGRKNSSKHPI